MNTQNNRPEWGNPQLCCDLTAIDWRDFWVDKCARKVGPINVAVALSWLAHRTGLPILKVALILKQINEEAHQAQQHKERVDRFWETSLDPHKETLAGHQVIDLVLYKNSQKESPLTIK